MSAADNTGNNSLAERKIDKTGAGFSCCHCSIGLSVEMDGGESYESKNECT